MDPRTLKGNTGTPALHTLVVDDNVDMTYILSLLLRRLGHVAVVANSAREAMELSETTRFDVIFLDIGLPDSCGYDVCKDMRQSERGAKAFIVALTGRNEPADLIKAANTGFDRHVAKPMALRTLREILYTVLQRAAIYRPLAGDGARVFR